ncbi:hypothetical protein TNCV_270611 [Trichonephila clavipes]|nr:hypothetical protein TNCV_270611 [Trichonephila clavipes]
MNQGSYQQWLQTTVQRSLLRLVLEAGAWFICTYADWCSSATKTGIFTQVNWASMRGDRMVASTSRTLRSVIQLTAYVRGSKAPGSVYRSSRVQKNSPDLNPINNLMEPSRSSCSRHGSLTRVIWCSNRVGMAQHPSEYLEKS